MVLSVAVLALCPIAEDKSEAVTAIMQPIALHQRVGGAPHHHAIGREALELVVFDDGASRIFHDDTHRCAAVDAITANDGSGADDMRSGLVIVDEVVLFHKHRNVAGDDSRTVLGKFVVVNVDDLVMRVRECSARPRVPRLLS